jgi:hypothetical protein
VASFGVEWAAGLFEGEGCIYIERPSSSGRRGVRLVLSSTDYDVLVRFHDVFDCGNIFPHKGKAAAGRRILGHKQLWAWRLGKANEVEGVIRALIPYMGLRRRAKMEEALKWLKR